MSVFAPAMSWVLAGTVVRGVAAGLIAGFGMGAIGALYDQRERPRVFGLYAMIWLLPSLVGPPLNAALAEWLDWRWALGWPAVLVVGARLLMGRFVSTVPWTRGSEPVRRGAGLVMAGGLVLGAVGSARSGWWAAPLLGTGVLVSAAGIAAFLTRAAGEIRLARTVFAFTLVCAGFFGIYEMLSLTLVEGLQQRLLWASVAIMAGLGGWPLAGMRPRPVARPDAAAFGAALITMGGVGVLLAATVAAGGVAVAVVVCSAVVAGLGTGQWYPLLSSEPFDLPEDLRHQASAP